MSRSKNKPVLEKLTILDLAAEGKSLARHEGMAVFVTKCVPGDVVDVQVIRKRKRFMEGYPVKFHSYSPERNQPFCSHFGICGGCTWQHLPYERLLQFKQQQVADAFQRIGKVEPGMVLPVVQADNQTHYRNKLEFTFSDNRWLTADEINSGEEVTDRNSLGFHIPGKFDKVLNIDTCHLQPEPSNQIRNYVREYALENHLKFFNLIQKEGFLRNLIIRNNQEGEFMVIFSFFREDMPAIEKLLSAVALQFPQVTSLLYAINPKANDTLHDIDVMVFKGNNFLVEKMEGLTFRISPKSFFQTNTKQAYKLYSLVRDFAGLTGNETIYDLYTGTGTIALFLAGSCKRIIGIESVKEAIADAQTNAGLNKISNAGFFTGDIKEVLNESFITENGNPDVIITDPPRTGMHKDVIQAIISICPRRIVYVSCNPSTQARDISLLAERYKINKICAVDMFPFTHHLENVALLEALPSEQ